MQTLGLPLQGSETDRAHRVQKILVVLDTRDEITRKGRQTWYGCETRAIRVLQWWCVQPWYSDKSRHCDTSVSQKPCAVSLLRGFRERGLRRN